MARLSLTVEGQTEQVFAVRLLTPHLAAKGVFLRRPQLAAHARKKRETHRGGPRSYLPFRNDIVRRFKEDRHPNSFLSTMLDLYGLPTDFPGFAEAKSDPDPYRRVERLEAALAADIGDDRFVPYIQLHEFEALLFSNPTAFLTFYPGQERGVESLAAMCAGVDSPEQIDDGQHTAPSKRIGNAIPTYLRQKPAAGPAIAEAIGLATIRQKCPHFNQWLTWLESLATTT